VTAENDTFQYPSVDVDLALGSDFPELQRVSRAPLYWQAAILTLRHCHILYKRKFVWIISLIFEIIISVIVAYGGKFVPVELLSNLTARF
jgi:hypothetical protein